MKTMVICLLIVSGFALVSLQSAKAGVTRSTEVAVPTQTFSDVPPGSFYYDAVEKCSAAGIMLGYADGTFKPSDQLSRWQAAVVIERAAYGQFTAPNVNGSQFSDVATTEYYYPFVQDLANRGVVSGCTGTTFCPNTTTSRDVMAVLLLRSMGEFTPPTPAFQRFSDVPPSHPFYKFIDRLAVLGITVGCGGGNYCPTLPVLRGDCAIFIVRAFGL